MPSQPSSPEVERTLASFEGETYLSLATFRRSGEAVETPVWFERLGDRLVVFTDGTSYKVKRLRRDERARVTPCDVVGKLHGAPTAARATILADDAREAAAYGVLRRKYGWQMTLLDFASKLGGRYGRRVVLEIELLPES